MKLNNEYHDQRVSKCTYLNESLITKPMPSANSSFLDRATNMDVPSGCGLRFWGVWMWCKKGYKIPILCCWRPQLKPYGDKGHQIFPKVLSVQPQSIVRHCWCKVILSLQLTEAVCMIASERPDYMAILLSSTWSSINSKWQKTTWAAIL